MCFRRGPGIHFVIIFDSCYSSLGIEKHISLTLGKCIYMLKAERKQKAGEIMNTLKGMFFQLYLRSFLYFEISCSQIKLVNRPVYFMQESVNHPHSGLCMDTEQKETQRNYCYFIYCHVIFQLFYANCHRAGNMQK